MGQILLRAGCVMLCCLLLEGRDSNALERTSGKRISGRELFTREWLPNDARSSGGDGLGPLFNESSCVACHNQGGLGGSGPESKNVQILSVVALSAQPSRHQRTGGSIAATLSTEAMRAKQATKSSKAILADLEKLHPDFAVSHSIVLHRFSVDPAFRAWRDRFSADPSDAFFSGDVDSSEDVSDLFAEPHPAAEAGHKSTPASSSPRPLGLREAAQALQELNANAGRARQRVGRARDLDGFVVSLSFRNTTALYGSGMIDKIPDAALLAAAKSRDSRFPEVTGRVSKLKDGRLGRFGWKGQQATLEDFTLTACAVELGLNVPGHAQSRTPFKSSAAQKHFDMTAEECAALTRFVVDLPRPAERAAGSEQEVQTLAGGKAQFAKIGCGTCHQQTLGNVAGVFSDLLLHDMGPELGDIGVYGGSVPNSPDDPQQRLPLLAFGSEDRKPTEAELAKTIGALRREWRTPPLWGCRDSAPYLHDGRAATLEEAVALHGGEGRESAVRFFALPAAERGQVVAFLKSLTAPGL